MGRPSLFTLNSWSLHEQRVQEVFQCALVRLVDEKQLPEREDDLNRLLLFLVRRENYRLIKLGRGCHSNIYYEASNQPAVDDVIRAARESKRPDFTCGLVDAQAGVDRFMVIEAKRLGKSSSPNWILNENYTNHGIRRFIEAEWAYGKDTASGIMIGYIRGMAFGRVLKEVRAHAKTLNVEIPGHPKRRRGAVKRLEHSLSRHFPSTPFRLIHIWVDSRPRPSRAARVA